MSMDPGHRPRWCNSRRLVQNGASLPGIVLSVVKMHVAHRFLTLMPHHSELIHITRHSTEPEFCIDMAVRDDSAARTPGLKRHHRRPKKPCGFITRPILEHDFRLVVLVELERALNTQDTWSVDYNIAAAPDGGQRIA